MDLGTAPRGPELQERAGRRLPIPDVAAWLLWSALSAAPPCPPLLVQMKVKYFMHVEVLLKILHKPETLLQSLGAQCEGNGPPGRVVRVARPSLLPQRGQLASPLPPREAAQRPAHLPPQCGRPVGDFTLGGRT